MKNEEYERARKKILDEEAQSQQAVSEEEQELELAQEVSLIDQPPNPRLIERHVLGLSEQCRDRKQCGYSKTKVFEPRLTQEQFEKSKWADVELRCPNCDSKCYVSPVLEPMEEALTNKYHLKSMKDTQELYWYDERKGVYHGGADWLVRKACVEDNPAIKTKDANDIKNRITWANYTNRQDFDPDIEWLCCGNVMVNLRTLETKPHSPDFMALTHVPHDYLVNNIPSLETCVNPPSQIMQVLYQVMGHEDVETVLDYIAYCLWRAFPFQRWLLFLGPGSNGKGLIISLIRATLGSSNVAGESLARILGNKYSTAKLYNKMANVDADLSSRALKQTGELKKLTGGDLIPAEDKYKPIFFFVNHAKPIFSANEMPETPDETDAFYRRPIIINFTRQFLGDKADDFLLEKLTGNKEEMNRFLTIIIRRVPHVLKNKISYIGNHTIEKNIIRYTESSNPIKLFYMGCVIRGGEGYVTKRDLYEAYRKFCVDRKLIVQSSGTFSRRFKDESGFNYEQQKVGPGKKTWVVKNISLKGYAPLDDEEQETLD